MITVKRPTSSAEIRQSARHVLFVEGRDQDAIDPIVLNSLFDGKIRIEPLGPSYHVRSVAEGLFKYHPDYYFLIDRDHYSDSYVEKCWRNFPDPETPNLLVWRRREIENYFLIPEYIAKSKFVSGSADKIWTDVLRHCKERLYLDSANQVITSIREDSKKNWIELFSNPSDFKTKESAIEKLIEAGEFSAQKKKVSKMYDKKAILKRFEKVIADMTGSKEPIEYGCGKWIEMIRGKKVFPSIVNKCFRVEDAAGNTLKGKEKMKEVVKELLEKPVSEQPVDFQKLYELIIKRVKL